MPCLCSTTFTGPVFTQSVGTQMYTQSYIKSKAQSRFAPPPKVTRAEVRSIVYSKPPVDRAGKMLSPPPQKAWPHVKIARYTLLISCLWSSLETGNHSWTAVIAVCQTLLHCTAQDWTGRAGHLQLRAIDMSAHSQYELQCI